MASPDPIPDAIGAVVAAVMVEHPGASPDRLGRLVVEQLRRDGWCIWAPVGRDATGAAPGPGKYREAS